MRSAFAGIGQTNHADPGPAVTTYLDEGGGPEPDVHTAPRVPDRVCRRLRHTGVSPARVFIAFVAGSRDAAVAR